MTPDELIDALLERFRASDFRGLLDLLEREHKVAEQFNGAQSREVGAWVSTAFRMVPEVLEGPPDRSEHPRLQAYGSK